MFYLFSDLWFYVYMIKDHSDREKENLLSLFYGLLFSD